MPEASVHILLNESNARINPHLYGHFMEHLGRCIDEGCWVGPDSRIPNTGGIRDDVTAALKAVRAPVIRWPGGCFADTYNWRDGVGPREKRPRRTNFWANTPYLSKAPDGAQKYEPNQFGTNEFAMYQTCTCVSLPQVLNKYIMEYMYICFKFNALAYRLIQCTH